MHLKPSRVNVLKRAFLLSFLGSAGLPLAKAQMPSTKPLKLVVPLSPGGLADIQARFLAPYLAQALGHDVIVENKPGASSLIGLKEVIRAAPDGKTLLYTIASPIVVSPHLLTAQSVDPMRDLIPVVPTVFTAQVLVARSSLQAHLAKDLVSLPPVQNTPLRYGSYGTGSSSHLYGELLASSAAVELQHVPYKGASEVIRDLVSGQIELCFISLAVALPYVKSGKLKILGVVGPKRNHQIPEVPTFSEQGFKNLNSVGWLGFFGPAKMPMELVLRFNEVIQKILAVQAVGSFMEQNGANLIFQTQLEFSKYVQNDSSKWKELIKRHKISMSEDA